MPHQSRKSSRTRTARQRRLAALAWPPAVLLALVVLGVLLWRWANDSAGVQRQVPKPDMIVPLPPPPPPPEEQTEPEPEPEDVVEPEPVPEPTPVEEPTPEEQPSPSQDLSEAMQIDGEAQAGGDAFNIAAGSGSGRGGSGAGVGNATYGQYLSYAFQRRLREDRDIRHLSYRLEVNLWLDPDGRVTRVQVLESSGDEDVDRRIVAALRELEPLDQKPPASLTLPVHMSLQGRRPG
ncbi:MAG: energy transducer TonB [Alcanivorax sp.]|uniref:energy transducer TonB family protein n=1 Tax=Alloalcanivorax marinus TaxID=1177169 RepID=UPI00195932B6|nr:energy transducer TonB [Alloalcanivorax marinus]MBM7333300.1 energy transducer TonB [Alloalcanivorax marinus]